VNTLQPPTVGSAPLLAPPVPPDFPPVALAPPASAPPVAEVPPLPGAPPLEAPPALDLPPDEVAPPVAAPPVPVPPVASPPSPPGPRALESLEHPTTVIAAPMTMAQAVDSLFIMKFPGCGGDNPGQTSKVT
jgi:hypothetical protein